MSSETPPRHAKPRQVIDSLTDGFGPGGWRMAGTIRSVSCLAPSKRRAHGDAVLLGRFSEPIQSAKATSSPGLLGSVERGPEMGSD